jgi:hypothetical protein
MWVTINGVFDWRINLLTAYTHNSELQAITAPPLISTALAKSFPACCVFTIRSLATATNSGDSSASRAQVLSSRTPVQNWFGQSQGQSQSYFTTGGLQPITSSWWQAPWDSQPLIFSLTEHLRLLSLCKILSDERMGLSCTIAAGPRQRSHSRVRVPRDSWPYFTVSDSRLPNLEGQVPVFMSPRNRMAQLYSQALGSLFVASYDSQGYGGGIRPRLHTVSDPDLVAQIVW